MTNDVTSAARPNLWADDQRNSRGAPPRGFGEAISVCWSKYATFSGRASRSEFWWFNLAGVLCALIGLSLHVALYYLVLIAITLPAWAVCARRLHDVNRSGWWSLLSFVPFGILLLLYWWCKGPVEPNDYD